jgi:opacity protein-like surface antigen
MMTRRTRLMAVALLVVGAMAAIAAADITGKWTSSFDTQIGKQDYTYDFVVKDSKLTGKMKSNLGESDVLDGKVDGDKVTFGEILKFEGMEVKITYTGTIVSADEIKFTRNVADFATEELVAKRVK